MSNLKQKKTTSRPKVEIPTPKANLSTPPPSPFSSLSGGSVGFAQDGMIPNPLTGVPNPLTGVPNFLTGVPTPPTRISVPYSGNPSGSTITSGPFAVRSGEIPSLPPPLPVNPPTGRGQLAPGSPWAPGGPQGFAPPLSAPPRQRPTDKSMDSRPLTSDDFSRTIEVNRKRSLGGPDTEIPGVAAQMPTGVNPFNSITPMGPLDPMAGVQPDIYGGNIAPSVSYPTGWEFEDRPSTNTNSPTDPATPSSPAASSPGDEGTPAQPAAPNEANPFATDGALEGIQRPAQPAAPNAANPYASAQPGLQSPLPNQKDQAGAGGTGQGYRDGATAPLSTGLGYSRSPAEVMNRVRSGRLALHLAQNLPSGATSHDVGSAAVAAKKREQAELRGAGQVSRRGQQLRDMRSRQQASLGRARANSGV